jgi:hypothetical protein
MLVVAPLVCQEGARQQLRQVHRQEPSLGQLPASAQVGVALGQSRSWRPLLATAATVAEAWQGPARLLPPPPTACVALGQLAGA